MITMIDYAKPLLEAEVALRDMYNALIAKDHAKAKELGISAIASIRLAQHAAEENRVMYDRKAPVGS